MRKILLASIMVFILFVSVLPAWSGLLNMPPNPVGVTHGGWLAGTLGGTIDITLSGIPKGYDLKDGSYLGWCAEDNFNDDKNGLANLYDSTDAVSNLPESYKNVPWDKVNYLLNHKDGSTWQIQEALWALLGTYSKVPSGGQKVQDMINAANQLGNGFIPSPGEVVAVLVYADGYGKYGAQGDSWQDTLFEVRTPAPIPPTVYLLGAGLLGLVGLRRRFKR